MTTTLIFVELLAAGTLSSLALILLLITFGLEPKIIAEVADRELLATIASLAVVYPLGVVTDGLADKLFRRIGSRYRERYNLQSGHTVFSLFAEGRGNNFAEKYFEYNRVRTRMVRSFLLNALLMLSTGVPCIV